MIWISTVVEYTGIESPAEAGRHWAELDYLENPMNHYVEHENKLIKIPSKHATINYRV
jgi:hypothetical protein